jgi:phosphoserine phosphatase
MMLEAVGNPVAINPDKKLLKIAKKKDWTVIDGLSAVL